MLKVALIAAGAFGLALSASPVAAQDYGYDDQSYSNGPSEQIEVIAPRYRAEQRPVNAPPGKLSLSVAVHFGDLDLRTREGAHELRARVRDAARDVCDQLRDAYPVKQQPGTNCYKDAVDNAMARADSAIRDARDYAYND